MDLMLFVAVASLISLCFASFLYARVKKHSEGTEKMAKIAESIRKGAGAYLKRQYMGVGIFFSVVFIVLFTLSRTEDFFFFLIDCFSIKMSLSKGKNYS